MNRLLSTAVAVAALCAPLTAWCTAQTTLEVAPTSESVPPGQSVEIHVLVSTPEQIGGLQFTLEYDSSVVDFDAAFLGADLPPGFAITNIIHDLPGGTNAPGTNANVLVQIIGSGVSWFTGQDRRVARFTFHVPADACGNTPIAFDPQCQRTHPATIQLQTICNPNLVAAQVSTDPCPTDAVPAPDRGTVRLMQNIPNPFNPSTTIPFEIQHAAPVRLRVFDVTGTLVRTLLEGPMAGGRHDVAWDGRDHQGQTLPSGVYYFELWAQGVVATRRGLLLQ